MSKNKKGKRGTNGKPTPPPIIHEPSNGTTAIDTTTIDMTTIETTITDTRTTENPKKNKVEITSEEYEEFQRLKMAKNGADMLDVEEYKGLLIEEYSKKYDDKIANLDNEIQAEKDQKLADWISEQNELTDKLDSLKREVPELVNTKKQLEEEIKKNRLEVDSLKQKVEKTMSDAEKKADGLRKAAEDAATTMKEKAKEEAKRIKDNAKEEAKKSNQELIDSIKNDKDAIAVKEAKLEVAEEELQRKMKRIQVRAEYLDAKEQEYSTSSPLEVEKLKIELKNKNEFIDQILQENNRLQQVIDNNELIKMRLGTKTPEILLEEIEELEHTIEDLKDKNSRYTDTQLVQMEEALAEKPHLEMDIRRLNKEIVGLKRELTRHENADRELENVKAQVDLIRTLNEHLKQELQESKKTLESRVGEVCPKLTTEDMSLLKTETMKIINERRKMAAENNGVTLSQIVEHVRRFAYSQENRLYYTVEDLCTFFAGMGASKTFILQGLSGTGKTSLPSVVSKALFSECHVVPVESSWRDRNELLGYYNDFSKKYTAKDFTCHLYRAGLDGYGNTIFFIVLDEMNLSRIEYYFADFLSVLEKPDTSERKVSLVDVDLRSLPLNLPAGVLDELKKQPDISETIKKIYGNGGKKTEDIIEDDEKRKIIDYFASRGMIGDKDLSGLIGGPKYLIEGNTIKIPDNVWFIGTANRDESTFEITDKVYDRAQVMNFKKAQPFILPREERRTLHISYMTLFQLFKEAKEEYKFDYIDNEIIQAVDEQLERDFKVSFGNRIGDQINDFVKIYVSAAKGTNKNAKVLEVEAIDYQIANKVLRKLEHKDTTKKKKFEDLRDIFEVYSLNRCKEIIDELIDREG